VTIDIGKDLALNMRNAFARIYEIPGGSGRFRAMEGLRAYAALLILLVHYFDAYIRDVFGTDPNVLRLSHITDPALLASYYLFASHYGVDIFFFLSGFLVCRMVTRADFRLGQFLVHRMLRIYPAALIALLIWSYIRIVVQTWYQFDLTQFIGNLLFLNALPSLDIKPYAIVTWSLFFEFVFYLTFPFIFLLSKSTQRLAPVHVLLFAAVYMWGIQSLDGIFVRFWMFFGGALMATMSAGLLHSLSRRSPTWLVILAFAASTFVFAEWVQYQLFIPLFVITTFFFVTKVLYGDGLLHKFFCLTALRYLGNISYSFYLMHLLAIDLVMYRYRDAFATFDGIGFLAVTFVLCLFLSVAFATMLFLVAERPYFQRRPATQPVILMVEKQVAG
jgi:exopolysaccharide production protein ExoZ